MSDLAALLVGFAIGLVIAVALLWRRRAEVGRGWRQRSANGLGALGHRRLTIVIHALAALGAAYLAVVLDDGAIQAVSILVCVVAVTSICVLLLQAKGSGGST